MDCKSAYFVENLTIFGGAMCRHRRELWPMFGDMKLCVHTDCGRYFVT